MILASHPLEQPKANEIPVIPFNLIQDVIRSQQAIILDDAQKSIYKSNKYIQSQGVKSVLCSPVLNQGKLNAIIYLENNLSNDVFTASRLELVQLIANQLAPIQSPFTLSIYQINQEQPVKLDLFFKDYSLSEVLAESEEEVDSLTNALCL